LSLILQDKPDKPAFYKGKFPFLHVKPLGHKIYSSFAIKKTVDFQFQDGEGDTIFT